MDSLLRPPIGFAHRGASAHAAENTLEAFRLALRLGATGVESDVWLTEDGVAVLDHDGVVRTGVRRRPIASVARAQLPSHIPTLEEFYEVVGTAVDVSLDVKDPASASPTVAVARAAGDEAVAKLWLAHHDWKQVAQWRALAPDVKLIDSTRLRRIKEGPERRAATLADAGIDAINMHESDWTAGLTTLFHRFERLAFAWDAQYDRVLNALVAMGCDAIYSDHVDRLVDALSLNR